MSAGAALLAIELWLAQPGVSAPPPAETAKLYFLAGDLAKAQEWARAGAKQGDVVCAKQVKLLAEYAYLANQLDHFSKAQAKAFIALDATLSPTVAGKLTQPIIDHFVLQPLRVARAHHSQGRVLDAWYIVAQVLEVAPSNVDAQRFFTAARAPLR